jgi:hypothetical protein
MNLISGIDESMKQIIYSILSIMILVTSCLDPYPPPSGTQDVSYLVIDGFLNASEGAVSITLSHTIPLSSVELSPPESGATVKIVDDQGTVFNLAENTLGTYELSNATFSYDRTYQLQITTASHRGYQSDFIDIKETPPIDSVTYRPDLDGLEINVNTHDPTGRTRYYRWRYSETWKYHSSLTSIYRFDNSHQVVLRTQPEYINTCYQTLSSTRIILRSTDRLAEDVISQYTIQTIPAGSIKLSVRYSILAQQQAITQEAYNYWINLQKTTESLGGLFDPLPSDLKGNIVSISDPDEPVIGFFTGGSLEEKRIFIDPLTLPQDVAAYHPPFCSIDTIFNNQLAFLPNSALLMSAVYQGITVIGYTSSSSDCLDCREQGGTVDVPDFWK